MTDIVERLRIECTHDCPTCRNNALVAANEIERLRARCLEHEQFRHQHRDCDAMGVENQHLRARLAGAEALLRRVIDEGGREGWPIIVEFLGTPDRETPVV